MLARCLGVGVFVAVTAFGCDRAIEPYVPGEQPEQPDLSRIFPEGAERAAEQKAAPMGQAAASAPPAAPGATAESVSGTIALAPELAGKVPAGAILFLIARGPAAGGPPLAVKRIESPAFPLAFTIGPDDRMIQAMPFVGPLQLSARLDADGNAMTRAPGDLQGEAPEAHQPGESGVAVVIDQVL